MLKVKMQDALPDTPTTSGDVLWHDAKYRAVLARHAAKVELLPYINIVRLYQPPLPASMLCRCLSYLKVRHFRNND